jgi:hypothetical protein
VGYHYSPTKEYPDTGEESNTNSASGFEDPETDEDIRLMMDDEPGPVDPKTILVGIMPPPLTHNPLHELESAWWSLLYVLAMSLVETPSADWDRSAQIHQLDKVFPAVNFVHKVPTFASYGWLGQLTNTFDSKIRGHCFRSLEVIRFTLLMAFTAAESTFPEPVDATQWDMKSRIYTVFKNSLRKLQRVHWPKMKQWNQ